MGNHNVYLSVFILIYSDVIYTHVYLCMLQQAAAQARKEQSVRGSSVSVPSSSSHDIDNDNNHHIDEGDATSGNR